MSKRKAPQAQPYVSVALTPKSAVGLAADIKTRIGQGLVLQVWLTKAGAERIADVTARNIGDSLAVLVNSVVVAVPIIRAPINPGTKRSFDIGIPLRPEEAGRLARAVSKTWSSQGPR